MLGWFRGSIRAKAMGAMVSVVLLSLVLTLLLGGFLVFTFLREQARDDASEGLQTVSNLYEEKTAELHRNIRLLASQPTLVGYVQDHDHSRVLYMVNPALHKARYDILDVIDGQGVVLARAHDPSRFGDSVADHSAVQRALAGETDVLLLEVRPEEGVNSWSLQAFAPLRSRSPVVGAIMGGWNIDDEFATYIKGPIDREVVFTRGDMVIASTAKDKQGNPLTQTPIPAIVSQHVLTGDTFAGEVSIGDIHSVAAFAPLYGPNGEILGSIGVVQPLPLSALLFNRLTLFLLAAVIVACSVTAIIAWQLAGRFTRPIKQLTEETRVMSADPMLAQTQGPKVSTDDEVGQLSEAFHDMWRQIRQRIQQEQELASVEERQRLARDLHDAVSQTLFSTSLIAEVLPRLWERDQDEGRKRLEEIRQLSRGALAEMRTLLLELRPSALVDAELGDLLHQLADSISGRARIPVVVEVEGQRPLTPEVKVVLYRIAQEALHNVAKHSSANQVTVNLCCQPQQVELRVTDDGCGFDMANISPDSLGIRIMRERAETIGALLTVESKIDRGTEVTVTWKDMSGEEEL